MKMSNEFKQVIARFIAEDIGFTVEHSDGADIYFLLSTAKEKIRRNSNIYEHVWLLDDFEDGENYFIFSPKDSPNMKVYLKNIDDVIKVIREKHYD